MRGFSFQDSVLLIQRINEFIEKMDVKITQAQRNYAANLQTLEAKHRQELAQFDYSCDSNIANVRSRSQQLINDTDCIAEDMKDLDSRLASVDKYYVRTKSKKQEELAGIKNDIYGNNADYFSVLNQIREDYLNLSRKYSEEILPALLNGLNYFFSSKRKKDYEDLIILQNTLNRFMEEIRSELPEITEDTVRDMCSEYDQQRAGLVSKQQNEKNRLENAYMDQLDKIVIEIDEGLNAIIPETLINDICLQVNTYNANYGKVNSTSWVAGNMLQAGFLDYPIAEFIQSGTFATYIEQYCEKLIINGSIKFPFIFTTDTPLSYYVIKDGSDSESMKKLVQGMLFAFMSSVEVSRIVFNVIDCDGHGSNMDAFFEVKRKLPQLLADRICTNAEEAIDRIQAINEQVEFISQDVLGTRYRTIYEYAAANDASAYNVEINVLFDFPSGLDEHSVALLKNIVSNGPKCGIYTVIAENPERLKNANSEEMQRYVSDLRSMCTVIQQYGDIFTIMGLQLYYYPMPRKDVFNTFFAKYLLMNESIKNKGIAFPRILQKLLDSKTDSELEETMVIVDQMLDDSEDMVDRINAVGSTYPEYVVIGKTLYPEDIFTDVYGYKKIKEKYGTKDKAIALPMFLNLGQAGNIMLEYDESKSRNVIKFTHNVIWNFISAVPVLKANICLFDPEKKGSNALPFLTFKKKCPDIFDGDNIYTSTEDIHSKLVQLNKHIDSVIQDRLASKYTNVLDYNKKSPKNAETLNLLVVYDFPCGFEHADMELLQAILKNGGKCGIYVVLCYNRDISFSAYDDTGKLIEKMRKECALIEYVGQSFIFRPFNLSVQMREGISEHRKAEYIDTYSAACEKVRKSGLSFDEILDKELFGRDLSRGLSVPVGIGAAEEIIPLVFGVGSSHHALVAGATGSGKSTLLHTLIMSAMLHYSPDLLNLYLMDFKSGTEFKIYESFRLPHIKLLALDAMQEFGESILQELVAEIERRSELFKGVGASKLGEYVKKTNQPMPDILVIMDEFQVLYNDATNRKVAYNCAELTKRIVTEGRSYGIHLMMATQATKIISNLTLETGTIEQMRIRVGLKCGEADADYLFSDANSEKALEMMKGPIGTAVINEEYTEQENIGVRTAYCDEDTQRKYLKLLSERLIDYDYDLKVFEGGRTEQLLEKIPESFFADDKFVHVEVGSLIKVADPLTVCFDRKNKHNTLICGSGEKMNRNLLRLYTLSILRNINAKVYWFDGEELLGEADKFFRKEFTGFGERYLPADTRGDIIQSINSVYDTYKERKKTQFTEQIFIIIKDLQFCDIVKTMLKGENIDESDYIDSDPSEEIPDSDMETEEDEFDFGMDLDLDSSELNVSEKLLKLIDDGAAYGIHFIVSSMEFQTVKECMYFGEGTLSKFPERYVFSLSDNDADTLIDGVSVQSLRSNIVYYTDSIKNTFQMKPYVFPENEVLKKYLERVL